MWSSCGEAEYSPEYFLLSYTLADKTDMWQDSLEKESRKQELKMQQRQARYFSLDVHMAVGRLKKSWDPISGEKN